MKKTLITIVIIVAILVVLISIAVNNSHNASNHKPLTSVAMIGDIKNVIKVTGRLEAATQVNIGVQVSGQIKTLAINEGDIVSAGQLVAEIDDKPQRNELRNAEAALALLSAERETRLLDLQHSREEWRRQQSLHRQNATTSKNYEAARRAVKKSNLDLKATDARIIQAQLEVDKRRLNLGYTRITAPTDGTIIAVNTRPGQTVNASQTAPTIAKIASLDRMSIRVKISEADILNISAGQQARFSLFAAPDKHYSAFLRNLSLAPESEKREENHAGPTGNSGAVYYHALLDVIHPDPTFRIGMTAQVELIKESAENILLAPRSAVRQENEQEPYVIVRDKNGHLRQQKVITGIADDRNIQILTGIAAGDELLLSEENQEIKGYGDSI